MKRVLTALILAIALVVGSFVGVEPVQAEGVGVYRPEPETYFLVGSDRYTVTRLTRGLDKSRLISLVEVTVPGGENDGLMGRLHSVSQETTIYIQEGSFAFQRAGSPAVLTLTNGELLQLSAGTAYRLRNNRNVASKLLIVSPEIDWTAFLSTVGAKALNLKSLATTAPEITAEALERGAKPFGLNFPEARD
jgi:hypothetical protein